jgi:hypothetical protein
MYYYKRKLPQMSILFFTKNMNGMSTPADAMRIPNAERVIVTEDTLSADPSDGRRQVIQ